MGNNKFCPSCKHFEKSPDNCGRKNGKYGFCRYGVRQGFRPRIVSYQHPICEEFKDRIAAVKCSTEERQADRRADNRVQLVDRQTAC